MFFLIYLGQEISVVLNWALKEPAFFRGPFPRAPISARPVEISPSNVRSGLWTSCCIHSALKYKNIILIIFIQSERESYHGVSTLRRHVFLRDGTDTNNGRWIIRRSEFDIAVFQKHKVTLFDTFRWRITPYTNERVCTLQFLKSSNQWNATRYRIRWCFLRLDCDVAYCHYRWNKSLEKSSSLIGSFGPYLNWPKELLSHESGWGS